MDAIEPGGRPPLSHLAMRYGPVELLANFFRCAERAARERGVTLSFADMAELIAVNELNRDSWLPLFPTYDIRHNTIGPDEAFAFSGATGMARWWRRTPAGSSTSPMAASMTWRRACALCTSTPKGPCGRARRAR